MTNFIHQPFLQCLEQYCIVKIESQEHAHLITTSTKPTTTNPSMPFNPQRRRDRYLIYLFRFPKTTHNVSRIQYTSPEYGEVWYLRLLLLRRPACSFNRLKTSDGTLHSTFEECERSLGLGHDENEYNFCMEEAAQFSTPKGLIRLFIALILHMVHLHKTCGTNSLSTCPMILQLPCPTKQAITRCLNTSISC